MPPKPQTGQRTAVLIQPPKAGKLPPAMAANWFHFAWSGTDVQMLTGYVDPHQLATLQRGTMEPDVQNRVHMSIRGFVLLRAQMQEVSRSLEAIGVPLDQLTKSLIAGEKE